MWDGFLVCEGKKTCFVGFWKCGGSKECMNEK